MKQPIQRLQVPGVLSGNARGIKRHNRRVIATYRRTQAEKTWRMPVLKAKTDSKPATTTSSSSATAMHRVEAVKAAPPPIYALVHSRNIGVSMNQRGDCPNCGRFGAHKQVTVIKIGSDGGRVETAVRMCSNCTKHFIDLPAPEVPLTPSMTVVDYDNLPMARERWNDCPAGGCGEYAVQLTVEVRDRKTGDTKAVLQCKNGHHFRAYVAPARPAWGGFY